MSATFPIIPTRCEGLVHAPLGYGRDAASQTYKEGAVLIATGSGQVAEASTEPTDNIIGVAMKDATGTTNATVAYYKAVPGVIFRAHIGTSTSAGDSAAGDRDELYPLQLSSNQWFVDKTDNNNPACRVVGFIDDVGTTNGLVEFEFIHDALAVSN